MQLGKKAELPMEKEKHSEKLRVPLAREGLGPPTERI